MTPNNYTTETIGEEKVLKMQYRITHVKQLRSR